MNTSQNPIHHDEIVYIAKLTSIHPAVIEAVMKAEKSIVFPDAVIEGAGDPEEEAGEMGVSLDSYFKGQAYIADDETERVRSMLQTYEEAIQRGESRPIPNPGEHYTEIMEDIAVQSGQSISLVWRIYGAHLEWIGLSRS